TRWEFADGPRLGRIIPLFQTRLQRSPPRPPRPPIVSEPSWTSAMPAPRSTSATASRPSRRGYGPPGSQRSFSVRAVQRGGKVKAGPLRGHDVALIVKRYSLAAGLDPAEFSGHSLRAGFAASAAETGASILKIVETTRHKSVDMLAAYVRRVDLFKDHAG